MQKKIGVICSYCESKKTIKNGKTHYGKQNYKCNICHRQFVLGGSEWFISDVQKTLISNLLLERVPLSGISRTLKISQTWLSNYIKDLYKERPTDLEAYLAKRSDKEKKA